jgi:hypothetical protein
LHLVVKDRAPEPGETVGIGTVDRKLGELTGHVRTSQSSSGSAKGHTLIAVFDGEVSRDDSSCARIVERAGDVGGHSTAESIDMSDAVHEPRRNIDDPQELLLGYLDYYRSAITRKIDGLDQNELRNSRLPSGWAPLELLKHLVYMEQRWFRWGFIAEQLPAPHGDKDEAGRWHVDPEETVADLVAALHAVGARTRSIVTGSALSDVAAIGGRFGADDPDPPPTLAWILLHVLQEYARHAGHLDVARELADGVTGE